MSYRVSLLFTSDSEQSPTWEQPVSLGEGCWYCNLECRVWHTFSLSLSGSDESLYSYKMVKFSAIVRTSDHQKCAAGIQNKSC